MTNGNYFLYFSQNVFETSRFFRQFYEKKMILFANYKSSLRIYYIQIIWKQKQYKISLYLELSHNPEVLQPTRKAPLIQSGAPPMPGGPPGPPGAPAAYDRAGRPLERDPYASPGNYYME